MKKHRLVLLSVALVLTLAAVWVMPPTASAKRPFDDLFISARASCTEGDYVFTVPILQNIAPNTLQTVALGAIPAFVVRAVDEDGTVLGVNTHTYDYINNSSQEISGSMTFSEEADGPTVTFELWGNYQTKSLVLRVKGGPLDTITVPAQCMGCEMYIPLTDAVSGALVANAPVYWGPDADLDIDLTLDAGKTFYTFGVDESGEYRQILLVCDFVWVPVETMGPNYDDVWNGMPLPMDVVD